VQKAVSSALRTGYRSIDTAEVYGNKKGVGTAIRKSGVPREDMFITTKLWNSHQRYDDALQAFDNSRKSEYLDMYLIHWPSRGTYVEAWRALEKLYQDGYARAIVMNTIYRHHREQ